MVTRTIPDFNKQPEGRKPAPSGTPTKRRARSLPEPITHWQRRGAQEMGLGEIYQDTIPLQDYDHFYYFTSPWLRATLDGQEVAIRQFVQETPSYRQGWELVNPATGAYQQLDPQAAESQLQTLRSEAGILLALDWSQVAREQRDLLKK
jgi:hypothetical protein